MDVLPRWIPRSGLMVAMTIGWLAACSGHDASPSGPGGPTGPTSLVATAGIAQDGYAGVGVAILPTVRVTDAQGRPVSGATVTFVVVAGGGTVDGAVTTSNADGQASIGRWTLGDSGDQLLEARLGSLTPARFRGTLGSSSVEVALPVTGGSLEITDAAHPYRGLRLDVPNGAYAQGSSWRVSIAPDNLAPVLPEGLVAAGPSLRIETDQLRASRLMTMRIPFKRAAGAVPAFVVTDPSRHVSEVVPVIATDSVSMTVAFTHLSPSLILGPPSATSARAFSLGGMFGGLIGTPSQAMLNALGLPPHQIANYLSDDWPASERGSYAFPAGHGPAIPLLGLLGKVQNIRVAPLVSTVSATGELGDTAALAALQVVAARHRASLNIAGTLLSLRTAYASLALPLRDTLTAVNLWAGAAVSRYPQLMWFVERVQGNPFREAWSAMYGVSNMQTWFSTAPTPTIQSLLPLGPGGFPSRPARETEDANPFNAEAVLPVGGSLIYPIDLFDDILPRLQATFIATGAVRDAANRAWAQDAGFPDVALEVQPTTASTWMPADTLNIIHDSTTQVRAICNSCPQALPQYTNPRQAPVNVSIGPTVMTSAGPIGYPSRASALLNGLGFGTLDVTALAAVDPHVVGSSLATLYRQIVPMHFPLHLDLIKVTPDSQAVVFYDDANFDLTVNLVPRSGYVVTWDFGDSTQLTAAPNVAHAKHMYTTPGTYVVKATFKLPPNVPFGGQPIATATAKIVVSDHISWKFVSATLQSSVLPAGGIGSQRSDTAVFNTMQSWLADLASAPGNSQIRAYGANTPALCLGGVFLVNYPGGNVVEPPDLANMRGMLAGCGLSDYAGQYTLGPIGNGAMIGSIARSPSAAPDVTTYPGGSINATMSGIRLSGSFVVLFRFSTGMAASTFTFQADQLPP